jgi:hypothetical protein
MPQAIEYFIASDASAIVEHTKKVRHHRHSGIWGGCAKHCSTPRFSSCKTTMLHTSVPTEVLHFPPFCTFSEVSESQAEALG